MSLPQAQIEAFQRLGHVTVDRMFSPAEVTNTLADLDAWSQAVIAGLSEDERRWYLENIDSEQPQLRKLDHAVHEREAFRRLAAAPQLVGCVEQLIGSGLRVVFSQVFMKPSGGGGPKPVHQDNFYFGPNRKDGMVTAWVALDDATVENGCLLFGDGSNRGPILPHVAPEDRPFDLQVPAENLAGIDLTPAPVPAGGVSFHHGNTLHGSAENRSNRPRRACAIHYASGDTVFATPALPYDDSRIVTIN